MLNKIKKFFADMLFSPSGTATLVLLIMILIAIFNYVNVAFLYASNLWIFPMLTVAFAVPYFTFRASRGGKKYLPTTHLALPKKYHIPTILWSTLLIMLVGTLFKLAFVGGKYTEFSLYNTFFAHRNGKIINDVCILFAFCIVPPIFEGIIFRGVILKEHDKLGRMSATVFSSFLFAIVDFNVELFAARFFIGILLCIVLYATDSIATSIAIHIVYSLYAVFAEPTLVSIKSVSSNVELFAFLLTILTLGVAIMLFSSLSKLYAKYSHEKF